MSYKLNTPTFPYYFSISRTFKSSGEDNFSAISKMVSMGISGVALFFWIISIYISFEFPSTGDEIRMFIGLILFFIYGTIHKKEQYE